MCPDSFASSNFDHVFPYLNCVFITPALLFTTKTIETHLKTRSTLSLALYKYSKLFHLV